MSWGVRYKPKKHRAGKLLGEANKRQQARQMCRNRQWQYGPENLTIVHPDGTHEPWHKPAVTLGTPHTP